MVRLVQDFPKQAGMICYLLVLPLLLLLFLLFLSFPSFSSLPPLRIFAVIPPALKDRKSAGRICTRLRGCWWAQLPSHPHQIYASGCACATSTTPRRHVFC